MHLTVKALDPFSPFISLPANIKHAAEEIRHWGQTETQQLHHCSPLSQRWS